MNVIKILILSALSLEVSYASQVIPMPKPVVPRVEVSSTKQPIVSPTFPDRHPEASSVKPGNIMDPPSPVTIDELANSKSTQVIVKDENGKTYSFSQFKKEDGTFKVILPKAMYEEIKHLGYSLEQQEVETVSDVEYADVVKQVSLTVYGATPIKHNYDKYVGGEGGRCAAGIVGGAIAGGLAGSSAGPAGAVAGAIAGGLVGSTSACR